METRYFISCHLHTEKNIYELPPPGDIFTIAQPCRPFKNRRTGALARKRVFAVLGATGVFRCWAPRPPPGPTPLRPTRSTPATSTGVVLHRRAAQSGLLRDDCVCIVGSPKDRLPIGFLGEGTEIVGETLLELDCRQASGVKSEC